MRLSFFLQRSRLFIF